VVAVAVAAAAAVTEFLVAISRLKVPTRRDLSTTKEAGSNCFFSGDR
jgi:hypothetical protein